jgi:hypothetical protein
MNKFKEFVAKIKDVGIAKPNLFYIDMPPPPFLAQDADQAQVNMISLMCQQAALPEMVLNTMPVKDDGLERQVVIDKHYGAMQFVFLVDQDMVIRKYFDDWIQGVVATRGGTFAYPSEYTVDQISINQLNSARDTVYTSQIRDAYPVAMFDMPLSMSQTGGYHTLQVKFVYRFWESQAASVNLSNMPDDVSTFLQNQSTRNIPGVAQLRSLNANKKNGSNMFNLSGEGVIGDNLANVDGQTFNFN